MEQPSHLTLTKESLEYLRSKVAGGLYPSESEVIEESLMVMRDLEETRFGGDQDEREDDAELKRWEQEEVGRSYDECHADPSILMTSEEVDASLAAARLEHARRAA